MSAEPTNRAAPRIREILEPLLHHGVDFVLIGGVAGTLQGSSLPSFDVDVAYGREAGNLARLAEAFQELRATLRGAPANLEFPLDSRSLENGSNFTFSTRAGDLDVIGDVPGVDSYDGLRSRAALTRAYDLEFRVASIDDLIAMKRAADRPKDRLMLEEYIAIADEQQRAGGP
jgi:hypothetical protein